MTFCKAFTSFQIRFLSYKKLVTWYSGLLNPKPQEAPFSHIVQIGDPTLRSVSERIPENLITSSEIKFLINTMRKVMKSYDCVGLAATQLGTPFRIFMLEFNEKHLREFTSQEKKIREMKNVPYTVAINPKVKVTDYTKVIFTENCESVKGFQADVPRYRGVELTAFDENGAYFTLNGTGWLARMIQHEMDHLNGIIYTDLMDKKSLACSCWHVINERRGKVELPYGPQ